MLYRFEKGDSANDAADEICTVYGSDAATIKDLKMAILTRKTKVKAAAQQRLYRGYENPRYSVQEIVEPLTFPEKRYIIARPRSGMCRSM